MSARSHETGEPAPGEPDEPAPDDLTGAPQASGGVPEASRPTEPHHPDGPTAAADPTGPADPPAPADPVGPADVDARWTDIVTHLRAPADPRSWAPDPDVEEAEDHFVPPEPDPVFGGDPLLTMAWCGVVGAPLLLLLIAVVWRDAPTWVLQAAGAAFLAGAGLLVWRMPHDREDDDGPGAVV